MAQHWITPIQNHKIKHAADWEVSGSCFEKTKQKKQPVMLQMPDKGAIGFTVHSIKNAEPLMTL